MVRHGCLNLKLNDISWKQATLPSSKTGDFTDTIWAYASVLNLGEFFRVRFRAPAQRRRTELGRSWRSGEMVPQAEAPQAQQPAGDYATRAAAWWSPMEKQSAAELIERV